MIIPVRDDLLEPTLAGDGRPLQAIYSQRTGYVTSFFGGPMAGAIVTAVNARRLGRLAQDAWLIAFGVVLAIALLWWQARLGGNEWLESTLGRTGPRIAPRIAGLGYFAVSLLVHRPFHRHMELAGIDSPSGWGVGIMAMVVSTVIYVALVLLIVPLS
jgi:hypothetical protein